jgi:hypothetical protein
MVKPNNLYRVTFYGNQLSFTGGKRNLPIIMALVSNPFIETYYRLSEGEFNAESYNKLSDYEKKILNEIYLKTMGNNKNYEIAASKMSEKLLDRINYLDQAMAAGNDSNEIKKEYIALLRQLVEMRAMKSRMASRTIKALTESMT